LPEEFAAPESAWLVFRADRGQDGVQMLDQRQLSLLDIPGLLCLPAGFRLDFVGSVFCKAAFPHGEDLAIGADRTGELQHGPEIVVRETSGIGLKGRHEAQVER
jgi:hypothetical protein